MTFTPPTQTIGTDRLRLDPLQIGDAVAMVAVLGDERLYEFTGGAPPSTTDLERRYGAQVAGSGAPDEQWHNWIVRLAETGEPVGFVQATVERIRTEVAWVIGVPWHRKGFASEAAQGMCDWLQVNDATALAAWIHPGHEASHKVARGLGLARTDAVDEDGEELWLASPNEV